MDNRAVCFSSGDVNIMLDALDEVASVFEQNDPIPKSQLLLLNRIYDLKQRLIDRDTGLTAGELRNVCLGLEIILNKNPLDWKASKLFSYLSPICGFTHTEY